MKVPDKIYVSRNFSEDNSPHGLWYLNKSEHDINVEYIRKDALLEFINEKLQESADRLDFRTNKAYAEVLDKLNNFNP